MGNLHKRQVLIYYLYSHGVNSSSNFKTSLFKHHYWCIIDASSCRGNQVQALDFNHWALETMLHSRTWNTTENMSLKLKFLTIIMHLPSGKMSIGSFVLSFTWSFNLWRMRKQERWADYDVNRDNTIYLFHSIAVRFDWPLKYV